MNARPVTIQESLFNSLSHLSYKYNDLICRKCGAEEENPDHILNCGMEPKVDNNIDVVNIGEMDEFTKCEIKQMVPQCAKVREIHVQTWYIFHRHVLYQIWTSYRRSIWIPFSRLFESN